VKKHHLATLLWQLCVAFALLWLVPSYSGGQTQVDVRTQTKNVDFSGAASTIPAKSGSSLPTSCKLGEMFFNTNNAPGQNLYLCAPANTWTVLVSGSGGSTVGTILSANTGQFAFYSTNGTTVNGHTLAAGDIPALNYQAPLSFTGNGAKTASSTGSATSNNCAKWDANGNVIDAGAPCGTGAGSAAFSALTSGANTSAALVIGSGASLAASGTGAIAATSVPASGVTGLAASATTDTTNASNIASGTLSAARLPATAVTTSIASGTGTKYASATAAGTSNDCAKWDANGNVVDAGAPCGTGAAAFSALTSGANTSAALVIGSGASLAASGTGAIAATSVPASGVTGLAASATTDTTNASNIASGTLSAARLPATAVTTSIASGTGTKYASATAAGTSNDCAKWDASGNVVDAGAPCSITSGAVIATNNLSDVPNKSLARTNIGVGPAFQANAWTAHGDSITQGYLSSSSYEGLAGTYLNATVTNDGNPSRSACDLDDQTIFPNGTLAATDTNQIFSLMVGTNDVDLHASTYNTDGYSAMFQACHQAAVAWLATTNKFAANSSNCTDTGSWSPWITSGNGSSPLNGEYTSTAGATKTCSINTTGGPIYAWVWISKGATSVGSYSVDSGAETGTWNVTGFAGGPTSKSSVNDTNGWELLRIPVSAGHHSIVFTATTVSNGNSIIVEALGTPVPATQQGPKVFVAGIPRQQGDFNSAATAYYDGLVQADVALLATDGLPVTYVPIRNYLCTTVISGSCYNAYGQLDMNTAAADPPSTSGGSLHPNTQGHIDIKQAFLQTMEATPYAVTSMGGSGTVNSGTAGQFAYYSASGTAVGGRTLQASDIPALSYDASGAAAAVQTASLQKANNLSDVANATTARTNLGFVFTGNGAATASAVGAGVSGNCAKWDANGNIADAGAPCGSGSGAATWASLSGGTNTGSAFVLGSGASLSASGTGTIAATSVPASGLPSSAMQTNQSNTVTNGTQDFSAATHTLPTVVGLTANKPATCKTGELYFATDATAGQNLYECGATNTWSQQTGGGSGSSGAVTDAQLPSDQCVLTTYTVPYSSLTAAASTTPTALLTTLAGTSTRICLVEIIVPPVATGFTGGFTGTGITTATVRLQSGASTPIYYSPNQDITTIASGASANDYWSDAGNMADRSNQSVYVAFTFPASSANLSAGTVKITIGTRTMP